MDIRNKASIIHHLFGDLSFPVSVIMKRFAANVESSYIKHNPLYIHLTITGRCNASCKGCINSSVTLKNEKNRNRIIDTVPSRDALIVRKLAEMHNEENVILCFYGGEPLLGIDKISDILGILDSSEISGRMRYLIYTNGTFLKKSIKDYRNIMERIWIYAIGIDGGENQHNRIRKGTDLLKIRANLKELKSIYSGNVIMWSTLREEQSLRDCFEEFEHLEKNGLVNQFFWHWVETEKAFKGFHRYIVEYEKDLRFIMEKYLHRLALGNVLPVTHINELVLFLMTGEERGTTACGVEVAKNYDILGGKIHACADLPLEFSIGELKTDGSLEIRDCDLKRLTEYKNHLGCYECGVHPYCGGRCPVQAMTGAYERLFQYCMLMRLHVGTVMKYMPEILKLFAEKNICAQDVYDKSGIFAQFTDVTP